MGALCATVDKMLAARDMIPEELAEKLKFPVLDFRTFHDVVDAVYNDIFDTRDHGLEGWEKRMVRQWRTMRERIPKAINGNSLLIVDEFHQPFITSSGRTAVRIMEFFRKLHDKTKCGIALCATHVGEDEIENGAYAKVLEQFRRRHIIKLVLPSMPPKPDINKFAKAFGLPPPEGTPSEIITTLLQRSGIKQYVEALQSAVDLAANQKKPISWDHFVAAYDKVQSLSKG